MKTRINHGVNALLVDRLPTLEDDLWAPSWDPCPVAREPPRRLEEADQDAG